MKTTAVLVKGTKTLPAAYFEEGRLVIRGRAIELNQQEWWNRLVQNINMLQIAYKDFRELHNSARVLKQRNQSYSHAYFFAGR